VLNTREAIDETPQLPGYAVRLTDEHTLEVEVSKEQNLNDIFAALTYAASKCSRCATSRTGSRSCSCGWSKDVTSRNAARAAAVE
jgi:recombinational DNA repair protein RecR